MFRTLKLIAADLEAKAEWCYGESSGKALLRTLGTDGTASMVVYRAMQAARRHELGALEMVLNKVNSGVLHCVIGRGAEFGPGFVLIHANGVVINGAVRGGEHVYLEHQVTIGAERGESPVLGNRVFVGAGAKIVGNITLGDDVKVGANAVVVKNVDNSTTVVGIPAKPIKKRKPTG